MLENPLLNRLNVSKAVSICQVCISAFSSFPHFTNTQAEINFSDFAPHHNPPGTRPPAGTAWGKRPGTNPTADRSAGAGLSSDAFFYDKRERNRYYQYGPTGQKGPMGQTRPYEESDPEYYNQRMLFPHRFEKNTEAEINFSDYVPSNSEA